MSVALGQGVWGLERARAEAQAITRPAASVRALMKTLFGEDVELRKRASDVARRITERDAGPLVKFADELAGLLAELPIEESRTRWHLGLVVPQVVTTREQRIRAARLMELLAGDESNVVRCSAVEGMGVLAMADASFREEAEGMVERYLRGETAAMRCRARAVRRMLLKQV